MQYIEGFANMIVGVGDSLLPKGDITEYNELRIILDDNKQLQRAEPQEEIQVLKDSYKELKKAI